MRQFCDSDDRNHNATRWRSHAATAPSSDVLDVMLGDFSMLITSPVRRQLELHFVVRRQWHTVCIANVHIRISFIHRLRCGDMSPE
jgi:hypothetical protein